MKITSAVSAHGTSSARSPRRVTSARPRNGTPNAAVSTIGSGSAKRPVSSSIEHEVDHREAEPAARFRREHADDAHLGELLPQAGDAAGLVRPRGAHVRGRALLVEEVARPRRGTRAGRR